MADHEYEGSGGIETRGVASAGQLTYGYQAVGGITVGGKALIYMFPFYLRDVAYIAHDALMKQILTKIVVKRLIPDPIHYIETKYVDTLNTLWFEHELVDYATAVELVGE